MRQVVGIDPARREGDTEAMVIATVMDDGTLRIDDVAHMENVSREAIELSRMFTVDRVQP